MSWTAETTGRSWTRYKTPMVANFWPSFAVTFFSFELTAGVCKSEPGQRFLFVCLARISKLNCVLTRVCVLFLSAYVIKRVKKIVPSKWWRKWDRLTDMIYSHVDRWWFVFLQNKRSPLRDITVEALRRSRRINGVAKVSEICMVFTFANNFCNIYSLSDLNRFQRSTKALLCWRTPPTCAK